MIFRASVLVGVLSLAACSTKAPPPPPAAPPRIVAPPPAPTTRAPEPPPIVDAAAPDVVTVAAVDAGPEWPGKTEGCPDGMVKVEGEYCTVVMHDCAKVETDNKGTPWVVDRCMKYRNTSRCIGKKVNLAFCMDRFEFPNVPGEKPRVLTTYGQAQALCRAQGKRTCTEDEFNFACEGPELRPYVYGWERDATRCNIDKAFRDPDRQKLHMSYDACQASDTCKGELLRVSQAAPIGANKGCASWAGVFDLNGNVGEWIHMPNKTYPFRGALKGGWWGRVRARCRATITYHDEAYYGYETGFRCCADGA